MPAEWAFLLRRPQESYGRDEPAAVERVKALYRELQLEQLFQAYEQRSFEELSARIQAQTQLPQAVFLLLLKKIYKRTK